MLVQWKSTAFPQLRARAFENMLAIVTCNYPAAVPDCNGNSSVFDGVVYLPDMEDSKRYLYFAG